MKDASTINTTKARDGGFPQLEKYLFIAIPPLSY